MQELEIIRHDKMDGLSIFFDTVECRTPHIQQEWELLWILDQPLAVSFANSRFIAPPGRMLLFSPRQPHEFHMEESTCTFLCI